MAQHLAMSYHITACHSRQTVSASSHDLPYHSMQQQSDWFKIWPKPTLSQHVTVVRLVQHLVMTFLITECHSSQTASASSHDLLHHSM
ncbi:hypothetical protein DPMN_099472 [Dreissena polymorpha]|uniref:Uncharacterized protein n=1 Tax=Dreissena polymorpha TaxID=45954 RepID=A0A9D4R7P1_DREPO|nr:hypothetical protein DPMN_099472 [Dreissena polymorpha]